MCTPPPSSDTLVRRPSCTATVTGRPGRTFARPFAGLIATWAVLTVEVDGGAWLDAAGLLPLHALPIARHSATAIPAAVCEGDRLIRRTVGDGAAARGGRDFVVRTPG